MRQCSALASGASISLLQQLCRLLPRYPEPQASNTKLAQPPILSGRVQLCWEAKKGVVHARKWGKEVTGACSGTSDMRRALSSPSYSLCLSFLLVPQRARDCQFQSC